MARLTKLGKLVDKMLDNPDGWTLYTQQDLLRHLASGCFLKITTEHELDFPSYPALSNVDKATLYPKAMALKEQLQAKRAYDTYAAGKNKRYRNRKYIYRQIISSIMGIE